MRVLSLLLALLAALLCVAAQEGGAPDAAAAAAARADGTPDIPGAPKKKFLTLAEVDAQAKEADKSIDFVTTDQLHTFLTSGKRFVFYGATWCKFCKRLTPKWLKLQQYIKATKPFPKGVDFKLGKVDCTNHEEFCALNHADAYPTLLLYNEGEIVEEYTGEQKVKDMLKYLTDKIDYLEYKAAKKRGSSHDELKLESILALRSKDLAPRPILPANPNMSYLQAQDPTLERSFRGHKDVVTGLAFKPSMTQLASSSMDHSVMIWNFKPQLRAFRFVGHKAPVTSVDFSPTGHLLASSSRDKTVRLWTPNVKGDVTVFKAHTSTVRTVQFSRDGEQILTASDDKTIKLWTTHRSRFQYTLAGHLNWVRTARFSPDSRLIASGSDDKTVRLWDLASKSCIKTYWDHVGMVASVAFHPSGTFVASASTDRSIKLFDIRTHKLIQHYSDAHAAPAPGLEGTGASSAGGGVNSIAFGGLNGEWLISSGMDGLIKVWDVKEGHLFYTLHGHKHGATTAAVFSPTGSYFATAGSDSQVMVWKSNFDLVDALDGPINFGADEPPDPASQPFVNPRLRPKTPVVASNMPISSGPSGVTIQRLPTGDSATEAAQGRSATGGLASGARGAGARPPRDVQPGPAQTGRGTNALAGEPEIVDVGAPPQFTEEAFQVPEMEQGDYGRASPTSTGSPVSHTPAFVAPIDVRTGSDQITATLQHIVRQIDVLTQTMSILEV
ncbi:hypothetical protein HK105_208820 [Polyrhizophydium stewartii]|uniref:Thioredoxin domain-containing protein n=1 Tax=Polyrhizophydium stewartii TaxID=2732419 RepID=A0ABR4MWX0_9FUNG|nr:POC1 centriolar protein A [Polyrhizophydium stewartii]